MTFNLFLMRQFEPVEETLTLLPIDIHQLNLFYLLINTYSTLFYDVQLLNPPSN